MKKFVDQQLMVDANLSGQEYITRINVDVGEVKVNNNNSRIGIVYIERVRKDTQIKRKCFDLPPWMRQQGSL